MNPIKLTKTVFTNKQSKSNYFYLKNKKDIKSFIKALKKKPTEVYEVLDSSKKLFLYFDIEYYSLNEHNHKPFNKVVEKINSLLESRSVSFCATRLVDDYKWKNSYHIYYPDIIFQDQSSLKEYFDTTLSKLGKIDNKEVFQKCFKKPESNILDPSVYKPNNKRQLMRIPYACNKSPNSVLKPCFKGKISLDDLFISGIDNTKDVFKFERKESYSSEQDKEITKDKLFPSAKSKDKKKKNFEIIPFSAFSKLIMHLPETYTDDRNLWLSVLYWGAQHLSTCVDNDIDFDDYYDLMIKFSKQSESYDKKSKKKIREILSKDVDNKEGNYGGLINAIGNKKLTDDILGIKKKLKNIEVKSLVSLGSKYSGCKIEGKDHMDELVDDMKKIIVFKNAASSSKIIVMDNEDVIESTMMPFRQSLQLIEINVKTIKKDKVKYIPKNLFTIFKNNLSHFQKQNIVFDPTIEKDEDTFNLFRGFKTKLVKLDMNKIQKILFHFKDGWCNNNEADYNYVLNWFAFIVQKKKKTKTAILVKSQQGCGKNILLYLFQKILGQHYLYYNSFSDFTNNFNSREKRSILTCLDECSSVGKDNYHANFDILKSKITEDTCRYESKGKEAEFLKSFNNIILFSNHPNPIKIEQSDRRYMVLKIEKKGSNKYFDELADQIFNSTNHFYTFLMERDIEKWNSNKIPINKYKIRMQNNQLPLNQLFLLANCAYLEKRTYLTYDQIKSLFKKFCSQNDIYKHNCRSMFSELKTLTGTTRKVIDGTNQRRYNFADFKKKVEKKYSKSSSSIQDICQPLH